MEATGRPGGRIRGVLSDDIVDAEIASSLHGPGYECIANRRVHSVDELSGYDAVYVSTGEGGDDFGLLDGHDGMLLTARVPGVFIGGGIRGCDSVHAIENGLRAASSVEEYIKTGRNEGRGSAFEECVINEKYYDIEYDFSARRPDPFEGDASLSEASRCPMCNCSLCIDSCELIRLYGTNPKRMAGDLGLTVLPVKDKIKRVASRMLNSCNLCGVCDAVCPAGVETCRAMYESRRIMGETGHIPPVFHDFWMEDLRFTLSDAAYAIVGPSRGHADILFFPGCQLAASSPDVVQGAFKYIREVQPESALMLSCCGVPAEWAHEIELLDSALSRYRDAWESLGRPLTLFACSTCMNTLARHIPEARGISVYEWLLKNADGLEASVAPGYENVHVFDPCASRGDATGRAAVRSLAERAGISVENKESETGGNADIACCGFGGHIYPVNPALTEKIVRERASSSALPSITYCSNCRDLFAYVGKDCRHILDVYFGHNGNPELPSLTQRRENRRKLKARYVDAPEKTSHDSERRKTLSVEIPDHIEKKMDRLLLLRTDAEETIRQCERNAAKLVNPANGRFVGYHKNREVTIWVEYEIDESFRAVLHNIYTHRMEIVR
jgi:Fe-S oxidoreductase